MESFIFPKKEKKEKEKSSAKREKERKEKVPLKRKEMKKPKPYSRESLLRDMVINKEERVLTAAIWYKDLPTASKRLTNITKGIVIGGLDYIEILSQMKAATGNQIGNFGEITEGFITNKGRFVDRHEAAVIAYENRQTTSNRIKLCAEDLY